MVALRLGKTRPVAVGTIPCMAGYSSTPTARKLGIKADSTLLLVNPPADWVRPRLPAGVEVTQRRALPAEHGDVPQVEQGRSRPGRHAVTFAATCVSR